MIRRMQRADIDRVANIWLDTNIRAHNFISKQYWQKIKERKYLYHKKVYTILYNNKNISIISKENDGDILPCLFL